MKNQHYTPEKGFHKPKSNIKLKLFFAATLILTIAAFSALYSIGWPLWVIILSFCGVCSILWIVSEVVAAPVINSGVEAWSEQERILNKELDKLSKTKNLLSEKPTIVWHRSLNGEFECHFCNVIKECRSVKICGSCVAKIEDGKEIAQ
jgi:hypothetical protein